MIDIGVKKARFGADLQLSQFARSLGFSKFLMFTECIDYAPCLISNELVLGDATVYYPGESSYGPGLRRTLTNANNAVRVTSNPFATSTCTYLWAEACQDVDTNGSVITQSRWAISDVNSDEIGSLQIRITATDVQILRARQAATLTAANARNSGLLNVCAATVAGNNGRHAVFSNGNLIAEATPTTTYTHGNSCIGQGIVSDNIELFGPLYFVAFAPFVMSDDLLRCATADVFSLFESRRIYIPTAAAVPGAAPTLSDLKAVSITSSTVQGTYDYAF